MRRLLTFSNILVLSLQFVSAAAAAEVTGTVAVSGGSKLDSDVIVWLEPSGAVTEPVALSRRTLLQKNKMFHPHVLPITVGTVVDFPNADPIFHNAFSNYDGQPFDVSLYPPGTTRSVRFRRPGVVRVFCNIHPMMSAIILVLDTPYFTRPDQDGRYHLDGVPPGTYKLHVFDERATKRPGEPPVIRVSQDDDIATAPRIQISEAGYVPAPHRNKYGQEYPADAASDSYSEVPQ